MPAHPSRHVALVVDDDDDIRDLVAHLLAEAGHEVVTASTGAEALAAVRAHDPDLVTLDLSLPDVDGTQVCRDIREFSDAYIVMITGRASEIDRLLGLEVGADDYLAKPFSPRELQARAASLLRRKRSAPVPVDRQDLGGGLVLESAHRVATLAGEPLPLTPPEVEVLTILASRPEPWERGDLVRRVWQGEFVESDFLVDVQVANVRRKLRAATGHDWVRTVGGTAYAFSPPAGP